MFRLDFGGGGEGLNLTPTKLFCQKVKNCSYEPLSGEPTITLRTASRKKGGGIYAPHQDQKGAG